MLLKFNFSNFRSFVDQASFSMLPGQISDLSYSLLKSKVNKKMIKALSSSVIYGANASGKTNIMSAFGLLKGVILSGNIRDNNSMPLPLVPNFNKSNCNQSVDYEISFIVNNNLFEYVIKIGGISFLGNEEDAFILFESLSVNNQIKFTRNKGEIVLSNEYLNKDKELIQDMVNNSLSKNELFLCNGYKNIVDKDLYLQIYNWFQNNLVIIKNVDYVHAIPKFDYDIIADANRDSVALSSDIIDEIAKEAGISANKIRFLKSDKDKNPQAVSFIGTKGVISRFIESSGSMKIINFIPLLIDVLIKGTTLIIDELDSSLNPTAVFSIINIFHNNEINVNNAQLIFSSHNPIYQKAKVFRRDEIKFVENTEKNSILYNLSDFGTSGDKQVKKSTDIMKNYLTGKYGAINYIDFSDVVVKAMQLNKEVNCNEQSN